MSGIRNLRDVALGINASVGKAHLKTSTLFRSGSVDHAEPSDLPALATIVNLRRSPDPVFEGITPVQVAPTDTMNNYLFELDIYQDWITRVFEALACCVEYPILVHCEAGKDRTGVAIALVLKSIGIPDAAIVAEYMLGDGKRYPDSLRMLLGRSTGIRYLQLSEIQRNRLIQTLIH